MAIKNYLKLTPLVRENLRVALRSIKSNRLRSILTIVIVGIGITSLVGILTATDALKNNVSESYEQMGANSFTIRRSYFDGNKDESGRIRNNPYISYYQAERFKELYDVPCAVSVSNGKYGIEIRRNEKSTNPRINMLMTDPDYVQCSNYQIEKGRNLTEKDLLNASFVCIVGYGVVSKLFNAKEDPINQYVNISGRKYRIIGTLKSEGNSQSGGSNQTAIIPITNGKSYFGTQYDSYSIDVQPHVTLEDMSPVYDKAEQLFRTIRRLSPIDKNDFSIDKNESMMNDSKKTMKVITMISAIIGLITLLGAAVGLMNIMLVSVKERTAEIGVRKAIGASSKLIRQQFLFESIVIAQLGCMLGIVLGVIIGNAVAMLMKSSFVMPWLWMLMAIAVCFVVGISSGYLPAKRAADMDPIEALRYE